MLCGRREIGRETASTMVVDSPHDKQMYLRFGAIILTAMVVMYPVMFVSSYEWSHVRWRDGAQSRRTPVVAPRATHTCTSTSSWLLTVRSEESFVRNAGRAAVLGGRACRDDPGWFLVVVGGAARELDELAQTVFAQRLGEALGESVVHHPTLLTTADQARGA
jgi:hypothetical protein